MKKNITLRKKINDLLSRRVEKILPSKKELEKLLLSGEKMRIYQGFDPTGPRLHLGHTVGLHQLVEFASADHEVIFLFGTGTVLVGDPSQREKGRKLITQKEIDENIKTWQEQVAPLVDFSKVEIKQNSEWLTKLTLKDIIKIAAKISAVQLFKRESFQRRLKQGDTVWYHETMYPLFQGYDSVVMDVDLEIGGTDQEFNMLIGRELQRKMNHREKFVLTVPMLMGTDGQPMSKTRGNCVWLDDSPDEMFGKLMRLPDEQIESYLELVTNLDLSQIGNIKTKLKTKKINPMEAKKKMAFAVVSQWCGQEAANKTQVRFEQIFQARKMPKKMPLFPMKLLPRSSLPTTSLLTATNMVSSKSEAKRLMLQGGVKLNNQLLTDPNAKQKIGRGDILQVGRRRFTKFV